MATATITVDLAAHGLDLANATPLEVAENFLDLMVVNRKAMNEEIIRVHINGTDTDVNLAEKTETPVV